MQHYCPLATPAVVGSFKRPATALPCLPLPYLLLALMPSCLQQPSAAPFTRCLHLPHTAASPLLPPFCLPQRRRLPITLYLLLTTDLIPHMPLPFGSGFRAFACCGSVRLPCPLCSSCIRTLITCPFTHARCPGRCIPSAFTAALLGWVYLLQLVALRLVGWFVLPPSTQRSGRCWLRLVLRFSSAPTAPALATPPR